MIDSPTGTARHDASPLEWAQIWAHEFSDAANHSGNSTFRGRPSLPWAQGVAGSNPVAPTTSIENLHKVQNERELADHPAILAIGLTSPRIASFRIKAGHKSGHTKITAK